MKQILLFVFSFLTASLIAQPVISSNIIAPQGYTYKYSRSSNVNNFNAGSTGANVTWNYANIDTTAGSMIQKMVKPDTTAGFSDFPNFINRAIEVDGFLGSKSYAYSYVTNLAFEFYGFKSISLNQVYTNPSKQLQFPFTFNNQFTDYYHDADSTYFGKTEVKADAYGTLVLPTGTFTNVLRVNVKDNYREFTSWDFDDNPDDSTMYEGQYYRWYQPNTVAPLLEYSKLVSYVYYLGTRYNVDSVKHLVVNRNVLSTSLEEVENTFNAFVYPNPSGNFLQISAATNIAKIEVADLNGKILKEEFIDDNQAKLNLENLAVGTYYLKMITPANKQRTVRIVHY